MTTETKEAKAVLTGGGRKITKLEELAKIPTPEPTKTWTPVPHVQVPQIIDMMVEDRKWEFAEPDSRYQFSVNKDGSKMFGVTKVRIPGVTADDEFEMAVGFRNSHDKSFALRVAVGTSVMVCDNLMITGDIQIRRIHTRHINPLETIGIAFDRIPGAAERLTKWFSDLRDRPVTQEEGVAILAEGVEKKALPIFHFMEARTSFLSAYAGENDTILHGKSMWAVYQSITEQFKKHDLDKTQYYSAKLNALMVEKVGGIIN